MKRKQSLALGSVTLLSLLVFGVIGEAVAQEKREYIQATAQGTSTQLGKIAQLNLIINEYSTADDQKALLEAFTQKGSEGLSNALSKMHSKGRISLTGTLGYDVNYIREFKMPDGSRKLRLITDRPIAFGEVWSSSRSLDYNLSAAELIIPADKKKSSGTLLPACYFTIDKENELHIELRQNAWNLMNIRFRD